MNKKEYAAIMQEITNGLTGDAEKDFTYIKEQEKKYRDHEYGKEIARACGRIMYTLIPDDRKENIATAFYKDMLGYETALEEIRFKMFKKELPEALKLMEGIVDKFESTELFEDDKVSEYHNFKESMEELIYLHKNEVSKELRQADIDYSEIYLLYGSLLYELERHEDAIVALEKAMRWNPSSAGIAFEHAENYKALGLLDAFETLTKDIFKIAFRPNDIAHCYRNLGYLYIEKGEYKVAICCELFSLNYENSNVAQSELYYISSLTGKIYDPNYEEIKACFKENAIPLGPSDLVLEIACSYGKHYYDKKEYEAALYFLSIANNLINDEDLKKLVDEIRDNLESSKDK